jgi:hypothetical protein
MPAFGEFAQDLVAAGVVEVTLGADHVQGTPITHKKLSDKRVLNDL